jgi:hypothetical protein
MVRRTLLGFGVSLFALGLVSPPLAGAVNCKMVMKQLSTPGRTAEDIADTMSISVEDVKKCQEEAAAAGEAKPAEGAAAGQAAPAGGDHANH